MLVDDIKYLNIVFVSPIVIEFERLNALSQSENIEPEKLMKGLDLLYVALHTSVYDKNGNKIPQSQVGCWEIFERDRWIDQKTCWRPLISGKACKPEIRNFLAIFLTDNPTSERSSFDELATPFEGRFLSLTAMSRLSFHRGVGLPSLNVAVHCWLGDPHLFEVVNSVAFSKMPVLRALWRSRWFRTQIFLGGSTITAFPSSPKNVFSYFLPQIQMGPHMRLRRSSSKSAQRA